MATVTFNTPLNMATMFTWYGAITGITSSRISISDGVHTGTYIGSFSATATDLFGTMTGYQQFTGSTLNYVVSGANADAHTMATFIQANQLQAAFEFALKGDDSVTGSSGADLMMSFAGTDSLRGNGGNDTIDGGDGLDTAFYTGPRSQYTVTNSGGVITVADSTANRDGTDTLLNVEQLRFSDVLVIMDVGGQNATNAYLLYQAAYARMPDAGGFRFWAAQADVNHMSALSLAQQFLTAPEFTQKYGTNPSNDAYASALYTNVLGRAPDAAGLAFWVDQLNHGTGRDQMLVNFAQSTENLSITGAHTSNGFWVTG